MSQARRLARSLKGRMRTPEDGRLRNLRTPEDGATVATLTGLNDRDFCTAIDEAARTTTNPVASATLRECARRVRRLQPRVIEGGQLHDCPVCKGPIPKDYPQDHDCPGWRET